MSSKSKARLPSEPLISMRIAFLRPVAKRVASKTPSAPPAKRPRKTAASSTVTGPRSAGGGAGQARRARAATGRSLTKVSSWPDTSRMRSPVMNWVRSMMWAPMSPSAPEPAFSLSRRHDSGASASAIQSWRYCARTWRISPIRPSATSRRARAIAGTRR